MEIEALSLDSALALEPLLVLEAVIARQPADQLVANPVVEDAADVLAGDPGHGGDLALADLLANDNPALAHVMAEGLGKIEQRAGDPALERQEASGRHHAVGVAQPRRQERDEILVDPRMALGEGLE